MQAGSVPKVIVKGVQELSTDWSLGCCVKTPVTASSRGVHCICNTLCVGPSQKHTNHLEMLQLSLCQAVLFSSLSLPAQHENQLIWTPMKLLFWVSHLCKFGRGDSGSKLMWIFSLIFMGFWIFHPKWTHHPHVGHLGELWCKLQGFLPWLWIYLGVPDPWVRPECSVDALFPSGCWTFAGWRQLNVSKPSRSPAAHGSRVDKRDLVHLLAPSSQKSTNFSKTLWLCLS